MSNEKNNDNSSKLHLGHRERLRKKLFKNGIEFLEPHEIIEILLFYSIPVKNTNDIAHKLIDKYKTIANVLDANPKDLCKIKGIGEQSAMLLNIIPQISRIYLKDKLKEKESIDSSIKAGNHCLNLFHGKNYEEFYLICLNSQNKINYCGVIHTGTVNQSVIYPRVVVEAALRYNAVSVIFSHNHPGGTLRPSNSDIQLTKKLKEAFDIIEIKVIDHIVVAGDKYYSFAENNLI